MAQTTSESREPAGNALDAIRSRPGWEPGSMMRLMSRLSGGVRTIASSIPDLESEWHDVAEEALAGDDPLWVVLGDSTAQGVGSTSLRHTWVARIQHAMREAGRPHGVINLARSGARASDVIGEQLPIVEMLPRRPAIVSCVVGTNDLMRSPAPPVVVGRLRELLELLPSGSIVATLPSPGISPSGRWINRALCHSVEENGHHLAELGPHLVGVRGLAVDRFHPSDRGYEAWVAAFAPALGVDPTTVPALADPPPPPTTRPPPTPPPGFLRVE